MSAFASPLLFLVSATTKVTETTSFQGYVHAYSLPEMLAWPAACFEYAAGICLFLDCRARGVAVLLASRAYSGHSRDGNGTAGFHPVSTIHTRGIAGHWCGPCPAKVRLAKDPYAEGAPGRLGACWP
jgi:hypothetical protein